MNSPKSSVITDLDQQLELFIPLFTNGADQLVIELRALVVPQRYGGPATEAGFFEITSQNGRTAFCREVQRLVALPPEQSAEGVYVTINPVNPALLARANNRLKVLKDKKPVSATDKDIIGRRWLPIDIDPVRPSGISATETEKATARNFIDGVRKDLRGRGWPDPLLVDSGNGFHLWYRIDFPTDDNGVVERAIKALAARHDTPNAKLDTSVFNPSRIMKLPGTWARKGDSLPDRPHRMSRVLEVPTQ
jgi:hypothetical protein